MPATKQNRGEKVGDIFVRRVLAGLQQISRITAC